MGDVILRLDNLACFGIKHLLLVINLGAINNKDSILSFIMPIGFDNIVLFIHLSTLAPEYKFISDKALAVLFPSLFGFARVKINDNIVDFPYDFVLVSIVRRLRLFICSI